MIDKQNALKFYTKQLDEKAELQPHAVGRPWFKVSELVSLYNIPVPTASQVVVGVISFGGGLVGSIDANGVLSNGDVQAYWS